MSVTLRSLLELRALLDSLQPNGRQRTSRAFPSSSEREVSGAASRDSVAMLVFDERSSAPDYAVPGALSDHPSGVPVNTESTPSQIGFSDT
jgi:hypothetical protein